MEVDASPSSTDGTTTGNITQSLDRYFLRLAMTDGDEKLQKYTDNYLVDIIRFAGTNADTLNKGRELLSHYNRRVKTNLAISFPVAQLLELINHSSGVTASLAMVYLRFSRSRLSDEEQINCIPHYIKAISEKLTPSCKIERQELLALSVSGLVALASLDRKKWPEFDISDETLKMTLMRFFHCVISFTAQTIDEVKANLKKLHANEPVVLSAMSPNEYIFVGEQIVGETLQLLPIKCAFVKLLQNGFVDDESAFPVYVLATATNLNAVEDLGESALKRIDIPACISSRKVVDTLMGMYLGSRFRNDVNAPLDTIPAASILLKQKIVAQLVRSETAATSYMNNVKIALDAVCNTASSKLQSSGLQFLLAILAKMPPSAILTLCSAIMPRVKKVLAESTNGQVSSLCYRCISEIGKLHHPLIYSDLAFIQSAFEKIITAPEDVVYSIVDCLVSWLPQFCLAHDVAADNVLQKLISVYVVHENPKCRLVSLKYIEALLRPDEIELKWMLIRACGDSRDEMRGEAVRLLETSLTTAVPPLDRAIEGIYEKLKDGIKIEGKPDDDDRTKLLPIAIVHMACKYLWAVAEVSAGHKSQLRIVEGDEHWKTTTPSVVAKLDQLPVAVLRNFQTICLASARETQDTHILRVATACSLAGNEKLDCAAVSTLLVSRCLASTRLDYAASAARLSAILMPLDLLGTFTEQTVLDFIGKSDPIPGSAWVSVCLVSAIPRRQTVLPLIEKLVEKLLKLINEGYDRPGSTLDASVCALAQLLKDFHSNDTPLQIADPSAVIDICAKIAASRKDGLSMRSREGSTMCIGYIMGNCKEDAFEKIIAGLYSIGAGPPQPELQFVVGAALFDAAMGQFAPSRREIYRKTEDEITMDHIPENERSECERRLLKIFETVVDEKIESANHHVRRAALIWLFIISQRATHAKCSLLSNLLDRAQAAFADGLTENDDFTQDVASKGVGLVYAQASEEQRKALVAELVGALSEGRRVARKLTDDTKLFEKGQLGKSPNGENLTTYKELCNLATDLNQPDLLYKFMQLAKHNSVWNAKKGAAFGFGAVFEQAKSELDPYVGQLVPKLYRYRYDPDSKVQSSMKSIWSVLTSSRKNVIDEYADEIAKDLIPNLTHKEWRVRESSCLALSDLLRGHDTPWMHSHVAEWLDIVLRVRDDIKESVRLAAERTTESLRKLALRLAASTAQGGNKAREFIALLLPILIEKGVHSSVKINKRFSLELLIDLAHDAGAQMKPWLHELIPCLLDAISDTEHQALNYIAVRSDEQQLEALDDARAQMARTSPMMTAIHDMLPQIDTDVLTRLQPALCDQLRGSVGVSTRTAAAQLITHLALRAPQELMRIKPVCDKMFNTLRPGVRDRNPTIRKQFGAAMSYLAKFASYKHVEQLMNMLKEDLTGDNDEVKSAVRVLLKAFSANAPELMSGYAPMLIPYVYLEKCRPVVPGDVTSKQKSQEWNELWGELVPSTEAAVRLYGDEIISCGIDILQNNTVWAVRAQAAVMVADSVKSMGDGLSGKKAVDYLTILLPLLSGRLWEGKGRVVNACEAVIDTAGERLRDSWSEEQREEAVTILKREASKRNKEYKVEGLRAVAVLADRTENVLAADWVRDTVRTIVDKVNRIDEAAAGSSSDEEGVTNSEKEAKMQKFLSHHAAAAVRAMSAYREADDLVDSLQLVCDILSSTTLYWKVKQDVVLGLPHFFDSNRVSSPFDCSGLCTQLVQLASDFESQRRTISEKALQVVSRLLDLSTSGRVTVDWPNRVMPQLEDLKMASEIGLLKKVQTALSDMQ